MTIPSHVLRRVILLLALLVSGPVLAAGFTCGKPAGSGQKGMLDKPNAADLSDLDVNLSGVDMQSWLKRLVGQYTYGGYVDLCGKGNVNDQRPVKGRADCIASGPTPNVHCMVNVSWPTATKDNGTPVRGGVSNLAPAEFIFSLEVPRPPMFKGKAANGLGLVFLQLDNKGNGEWFSGVLRGDTFTAVEPCVDIPGDCHKRATITAKPDSNEISMRIDVTIDSEQVLSQAFLLQRKPNAQRGARSTGSAP